MPYWIASLLTPSITASGEASRVQPAATSLSSRGSASQTTVSLEAPIFEELDRLSRLHYVNISMNSLDGRIPSALGNCSNLRVISLRTNRLKGFIPATLGNLDQLLILDLPFNSLTGSIPISVGILSSLLYFAYQARYHPPFYNLSATISLAISSNQLEGTLPSDIGDLLPYLHILLMHQNLLEGPIPASLSNASALNTSSSTSMAFTGTIPSSIRTLQSLYWLDFSYNQPEASKPSDWSFMAALTNCTNLQLLDVGYNLLRGMMPSSISNLSTRHDTLAPDKNQISGNVPAEIGKYHSCRNQEKPENTVLGSIGQHDFREHSISIWQNVDSGVILSNNKLSGNIPKEVMKLSSLSIFLDLSYNLLNGSLPLEVGNLKKIGKLDFSHNKLSGEIPSTISECEIVERLHMEGNLFEGPIPSSCSNLRGLKELDLSNNLSGQIPKFLDEFPYLQYFNLSFNNFEGQVPTEGVFKNASAVSLRGNTKLCGGIPELHFPACKQTSLWEGHSHVVRTILLTRGRGAICLTIVLCLFGSRHWIWGSTIKQLSIFLLKDWYTKISYNELFKATDGFSSANIIGTGSFGSVYKGIMNYDNASIVAVKVLNLQQHGAFQSFTSECEAMRSIHHRNLVKVLTSCSSSDHQGNDFKALVFEFMPNGSLEEWLHPNACMSRPFISLSLIQRLNIAIDIGAALEYLHHHGPVPIVHCDLKPSNALLDSYMTAHVGDFGLAKFLIQPCDQSSQCSTSTIGIKGSIGYVPPEYGMGCRASIFGDVYSYGILLLEMFTGVNRRDDKFKDGLSLHASFPEQIMDIIDNRLFLEDNAMIIEQDIVDTVDPIESTQNCLILVIKYGLLCSKESPKE
ncbi:LOW QUALITY PROTEIN: receptor kinase-like protein Xa21 [Typha latifolia]|uniref:LOW QUALITY PROTEIN: receptor kinase-like protein Xa21 n=1 Tax=Typha latifolia TaxID=4733 RepID=UPI003C2B9B3D